MSRSFLLFCLCFFTGGLVSAQCDRQNVLTLIKKDSSGMATLRKGARIEVIAGRHNYSGRLECVGDSAILVEGQWIGLSAIELLTDPNESFKWRNIVAWPMIGAGLALGGIGIAVAASPPEEQSPVDEEVDNSWLGGLVLVGVGAGLTWVGLKLVGRESVNNDLYYSPGGYHFRVLTRLQAKYLKKSIPVRKK